MVSCRDVLWLVSFFILWSPVGCPSQFKVAFEQEWFLLRLSPCSSFWVSLLL